MKKLLASAALALTATPAVSTPALPDADPAIWAVKDEDTTIYLFGTFHLLDGKRDWFNDEVKAAFDASQEVVLEAIIPDDPAMLQPLIVKYAMDPAGRTLSSRLEPALKDRLKQQLAALGIPAEALEPMEPWFVSTMLASASAQKLGMSGEHGAEALITKAARAAGKPVDEIEGLEFQLSLFDTVPENLQIAMLSETIGQLAEIDEMFAPMVAAWAAGDTETVARFMNEGMDETPELFDIMLTNRNAAWAEWIDQRLDRPGTVFMAVGAGHLAGKNSVQDLLLRRGIQSARVRP
ncbi:TraB/GumN family protein [Sphingosinicella rhizophila]|uniref:TraB/GumN family protein n=1 Tax=Sphingosinicella rhizophila TaxID=3050082 RepID=A0ABU3Q844_9SPHN|nr:TraB/GumN family protein [Sphingosinicella sp. GR2756]MDT9599585.1 TraB/GumN family protein [Sphingosinicella sp. GR2756]